MSLQQFRQLEELNAVAALDEDIMAFGALALDLRLYGLDIGELSEVTVGLTEFFTDEPYLFGFHTISLQMVYDLLVFLGRGVAELAHITKDKHLVVYLHELEVVQGRFHARRVGIIGIDDEVVIFRSLQLTAVVAWCILLQSGVDLTGDDAEMAADGDGGEEVVEVIGADKFRLYLIGVVEGIMGIRPLEAEEGRATEHTTFDLCTFILAIGDDAVEITLLGHIHQVLIAGVEEEKTVMVGEEVIEFPLRLLYAVEGAETEDMGVSDIRDETAGRLDILHKALDIVGMAGSHLYDSNVIVCREAHQRLRHANIVVEVTFRMHHAVTLGKDGGDELLRRRLTVCARDTDDGDVELAAVFPGELLESRQRIVDDDVPVVTGLGIVGVVDDSVAAAFL